MVLSTVATVILQWKLCVINAKRDLEVAAWHSIATGNADPPSSTG
ncbi:hypothetical protein OG777_30975 [Micromonospora peucetia]|nr:hypothetical protein [Micromonospora peucetia]MCX4391329.1 hypothetical protein [Micromonospora peucetia]